MIRQLQPVAAGSSRAAIASNTIADASPAALLARLKGIGPQIASVLWLEGLFRQFSNRREVVAYAGLVPTPWRSQPR